MAKINPQNAPFGFINRRFGFFKNPNSENSPLRPRIDPQILHKAREYKADSQQILRNLVLGINASNWSKEKASKLKTAIINHLSKDLGIGIPKISDFESDKTLYTSLGSSIKILRLIASKIRGLNETGEAEHLLANHLKTVLLELQEKDLSELIKNSKELGVAEADLKEALKRTKPLSPSNLAGWLGNYFLGKNNKKLSNEFFKKHEAFKHFDNVVFIEDGINNKRYESS